MIADSDRFFTYAIQQENRSMHKTVTSFISTIVKRNQWNVLHFKIKLQKRMEKTEKYMPHSGTIVSLLRKTKKEYYGNLTRKM